MNIKNKKAKWTLIGCLAGLAIFGVVSVGMLMASDSEGNERFEPTSWSGWDRNHPWFDGKDWDWFRDMFNQPSLKPQEEGTIQNFPLDSVPRDGVEVETPENQRENLPKNSVAKTKESLARGQVLYNTYCGACHGTDGQANTPVSEKGMFAPPVKDLFPSLTEAHIYNKIRYGGPVMPPYAIQTSQQDRWDIVNYAKSRDFGK